MKYISATHFKYFAKAIMAWAIVLVLLINPLQMVMAVDAQKSQQHSNNDTSMVMDHMKGKHLNQAAHDNSCCNAPTCVHLNSASSLLRKMMYVDTDYAASKVSYSLENEHFIISYYPEQPKRPPRV